MSKVFVYRNLRKQCWSVKDIKTGLVIKHADRVMVKDATFKVSEAGRQRVLRNKRKNVHAGIMGELVELSFVEFSANDQVSYNPYKGPHFIISNGEAIHTAKLVELGYFGKVYI